MKNDPKENMKTEFEEINEIVGDYKYGFKTEAERVIDIGKGLNEEIVRKISAIKGEPKWMLDIRVKAYQYFVKRPLPSFGPDL